MSANLQDRGPRDLSRVNLSEDYEVRYWAVEFGCTEAELRAAVVEHGDTVEAIRRVLKRQGAANFMESDP